MAKVEPPANEEERRAWIKRQKAEGVRAFKGRYGWTTSSFGPATNPRTADQQRHRQNILAVSRRWRTLSLDQQRTWRVLAANTFFVNDAGERVRLNCFKLFVGVNTRRADLNLPQFDAAPAQPVFSPNPVEELACTWTEGKLTLLARVEGMPEQLILVRGARPRRSSAWRGQHFPFLGFLPPPINGWSDLTGLYVARYGVPPPNQAIWIRFCQHRDGFTDMPKTLRVGVPPLPA
ncbi:MAG TPA: hypothetical protein PKI20_09265 [Verrucomicrobiota bacterium]|jgi:hypothetical protein|nr:hypothetical protein [Verrucomicrobiota bacterium]HQL77889.1 hypothetical protein [Verrucomicrobiota bacterium]